MSNDQVQAVVRVIVRLLVPGLVGEDKKEVASPLQLQYITDEVQNPYKTMYIACYTVCLNNTL